MTIKDYLQLPIYKRQKYLFEYKLGSDPSILYFDCYANDVIEAQKLFHDMINEHWATGHKLYTLISIRSLNVCNPVSQFSRKRDAQ